MSELAERVAAAAVAEMTEVEKWLNWRRSGIGASDVAKAVTGLYGGRVAVVADKLGIVTDDIDPALAERGHAWEQPIADVVLAAQGLFVIGEQMLCAHPERPRHLCTLDGFLHEHEEATIDDLDKLLEIKTRGISAPYHWDYYRTQVQFQMHVTGMSAALIVVATIDDLAGIVRVEFEWVERDQWVIDQLVVVADELWAHVEAGTLPEPTDGSTLDIIKAANATAAPDALADIDPIADVIADYDDLKARAKAANDALKHYDAQIRIAMGEATEAKTTDGRWRVRVGKPINKFTRDSETDALDLHGDKYAKTVLDRARFKAEQPDDYDALKRPTADRRMTIKEMNA